MRPTTLFWLIVVIGLSPYYERVRLLFQPREDVFAARDRQVLAIRLIETAVVIFYVVVIYVFGWNFPLTRSPQPLAWAGLAVTALGIVVASWAKIQLGKYFSITLGVRREHQVIDKGPYAWIRHPIYTGLLLVAAGGALVYNSGATLLLLVLPFVGLFYWQSIVEEKLLVVELGQAYLRYREKTGRLLPRLR